MRKLYIVFCIFICTFHSIHLKASHLFGGEITWECLSNGLFVFKMKVYRECSGLPHPYINQTLDVLGNPLPNNGLTSQITLKPDTAKWNQTNNGYLDVICDTGIVSYSCLNAEPGALQVFYYKSDPYLLSGTPPNNGWTFYWSEASRSPLFVNLQHPNSLPAGLRCIMYPVRNSSGIAQNINGCNDNSPRVIEEPSSVLYCYGVNYDLNISVSDLDEDSLTFNWDKPIAQDPSAYMIFANGYSFNNPFPDRNFDSRNIPATLNDTTGNINFSIFGANRIEFYSYVVRVDAYRNGYKVASFFHDKPITLNNCLADSILPINRPPIIKIEGSDSNNLYLETFPNRQVSFDINIRDVDSSNTSVLQNISLEANSFLFSNDFSDPNNCFNPSKTTCATLTPPPIFDSIEGRYLIKNIGSMNTKFKWQPNCANEKKDYLFFLSAKDDYCPGSGMNKGAIKIRVKPKSFIEYPIMVGASIELDGTTRLNIVPPIDSTYSFAKYIIGASTSDNGVLHGFVELQEELLDYYGDKPFSYINFPINIYTPFPPNKDYHFVLSTRSGCKGDYLSSVSAPVRVIELDLMASTNNEIINLSWNKPTITPKPTAPYYKYRSKTYYYIWQNDSAKSNVALKDSALWYLRGSTTSTSFNLAGNLCNELAGYRVEARDTVVTFKQGYGFLSMEYDTLTFSTFSIVDIIMLNMAKPNIDHQVLESISSDVVAPNYQWIDCNSNSIIQNETLKTFIPTDTGKYRVEISNDTCAKMSDCFSITTVLNDSVTQVDNQTLLGANVNQKFQWIDCRADTIIPGATNQTFIPADTGYYAVIVSAYGYKDTSRCIPMIAIGVKENQFEKGISVTPNPTNGILSIELGKFYSNVKLRLLTIQGQQLDEKIFSGSQFSFEINQSQGIYFIELQNQFGEISLHKVIKN